jgi:hypothetical protein
VKNILVRSEAVSDEITAEIMFYQWTNGVIYVTFGKSSKNYLIQTYLEFGF